MAISTKKITKRTSLLLVAFIVFLTASLVRIFLGGSHVDLSKLDPKAKDLLGLGDKDSFAIPTARADVPPPPGDGGCSDCAGTDGGCSDGE